MSPAGIPAPPAYHVVTGPAIWRLVARHSMH